ncbi:hypothetical protein HBI56_162380 [Parastagonospora nodorum]|nr:hypothetical protein HBH56_210260 [Parastagonospora nodorum]KAH3931592.1 hypothetical protein HBH54_098870 [Parastagonospora nodorum]KAH3944424.1 hypothetical protein HBH53_160330 [Parastagonospora nodorum]KAH3960657.1 hypothetical protein HBH51_188620 [Parastagonospora nodorum]KAH3962872.1 hypothetical protein HBH52_221290 [Parastagonospora nodorum]
MSNDRASVLHGPFATGVQIFDWLRQQIPGHRMPGSGISQRCGICNRINTATARSTRDVGRTYGCTECTVLILYTRLEASTAT